MAVPSYHLHKTATVETMADLLSVMTITFEDFNNAADKLIDFVKDEFYKKPFKVQISNQKGDKKPLLELTVDDNKTSIGEVMELIVKIAQFSSDDANVLTINDLVLSDGVVEFAPTCTFLSGMNKLYANVKMHGGAKKPPQNTALKRKMETFTKTFDDTRTKIDKTTIQPLQVALQVEQTLATFLSEVDTDPEKVIKKYLAMLTEETLEELEAKLTPKGGNIEGKLDECSALFFRMSELMKVKDTIEAIESTATSLLPYGVSKLPLTSEKNSEAKVLQGLIEKAKFTKIGQKQGASNMDDDP